MNEQLQGKLVEILSDIQEGVRAAGSRRTSTAFFSSGSPPKVWLLKEIAGLIK